jgi:hypothetical protein
MLSLWSTALKWSKDSATHLWANLVIAASVVAGAAMTFGNELLDTAAWVLDDPDLKAQVVGYAQGHVSKDLVPLLMIAVAIVSKKARDRTLAK